VRPDDPVALVAALRSELFGISDAALYEFKRAGGRFSFRRSVPATGVSAASKVAIDDAFNRLNLYFKWLALLPSAASVEKIAEDLGLMARASASPGGDIRAGSLAKVFELVRAAQREQSSMLDLLEYLEGLVVADQKYDGISVRPHPSPVVRLMNLHKVKGLEAPIVFLGDPTGMFEHPIDLHIDRSGEKVRGYIAVYAPRPQQGFARPDLIACPTEWARHEEAETDFVQAENERLLYVAATRAGACLVVSHRDVRPKESPWHTLAADLSEQETHQDPGEQSSPARPHVTVTAADLAASSKNIDERWNAVRRATYTTESIKEISLIRPRAFSTAVTQEAEQPSETSLAGEHGVEWGEDMHALLEAAMRAPDSDLEGLARSLSRVREDDNDRVEALLSSVRNVQQSSIWKRALASQRRLAEVPLVMTSEATADDPAGPNVRRGVIDLAFREPKGWVIVDYKTDRVDQKTLAQTVEYYRPQVQSYADAWGMLLSEPVHEVGLFFTRTNQYKLVNGAGA
jgi:ATP-dependent helicase/nuclease subunit A